jgi:hypothetical protein
VQNQYLGDYQTITDVVGMLASEAYDALIRANGQPGSELIELADRYARIFLGESDEYQLVRD